jgi:hypothetical protein
MPQYDISSPVNAVNGFLSNATDLGEGSVSSIVFKVLGETVTADGAATTVGTVTIANVSAGASYLILLRSVITATSHVGDSNRASLWVASFSRVAGSVMVGTLSSALGAVIATSGSSTLTSTLALGTVSGGGTASNSIAIQVTNTGTPASACTSQITIIGNNALAGGATIA